MPVLWRNNNRYCQSALGEGGSITLEEATREFFRQERKNVCAFGPSESMMELPAGSERFRHVRLSRFQRK